MCDHLNLQYKPPTLLTLLFKEECTLCFDNQDTENGIDVCLLCFNGSCPKNHTKLHSAKHNHPLYLNIKRKQKLNPENRPEKMTKLMVQDNNIEYEFETVLKCHPCNRIIDKKIGQFLSIVEGILNGASVKKQADLKAWQEESLQKCYHTDEMKQEQCFIQSRGSVF